LLLDTVNVFCLEIDNLPENLELIELWTSDLIKIKPDQSNLQQYFP